MGIKEHKLGYAIGSIGWLIFIFRLGIDYIRFTPFYLGHLKWAVLEYAILSLTIPLFMIVGYYLEKEKMLSTQLKDQSNKIEERNQELYLLQEINNALNSRLSLDEILQTIINGMTSVFNYYSSGICLLSKDGKSLVIRNYSLPEGIVKKIEKTVRLSILGYEIPLHEGSIFTKALEERKPIVTQDIVEVLKNHTDKEHIKALGGIIARIIRIKSGIGIPLVAGDKVIGMLGATSKSEILSEKDVNRLTSFGNQVALAIEKADLYGQLQDYSDHLERKVEEKTLEILKTNGYLASIIETSADGIISLDEAGIVSSWNKGAEGLFGYSADEIIGQPFHALISKRYKKTVQTLRTERRNGSVKNYGVIGKRKDGIKIDIEITESPLKDEKGKLIGTSAIIRDITERKEMELQLFQAEKLATVGQLAAGVAHEINNPLTSLSLDIQMLIRDKSNPSSQVLDGMDSKVDIIAKIVRDLLDFSRQRELKREATDINQIIEGALHLLAPHLKKGKIKVALNFESTLPLVEADPRQLKQALVNILINSIQAMPNGGKLKIKTRNSRGAVEVIISDTGVGIPQEHLHRIFDPFFTTKSGGTGLGLSVVHGIVDRHGGKMKVDSHKGTGTSFTITLPVGETP